MSKGVTVYDYFPDDEDDEPVPAVDVVLTEDHSADDMAQMIVECFGRSFALELAAALGKAVSAS